MTDREEPPNQPEPPLYYWAARFRREAAALLAYQHLERLFFREECDLSAFRFLLSQAWYVATIGEEPPKRLQQRLAQALRSGESAVLPQQVLKHLSRRRAENIPLASWVERHYQPE